MNQTLTPLDLTLFDVRLIPCRAKHAQIFQRWADLPVGSHFVLINDHDPVPLFYQFEGLYRGAFEWEYLVDGPTEFHVKITRLAPTPFMASPGPPRRPAALKAPVPAVLDLRGLEPPEPMLRILTTLEAAAPGTTFCVRTDRQPIHLFPELAARGAQHVCEAASDGSWLTTITRG